MTVELKAGRSDAAGVLAGARRSGRSGARFTPRAAVLAVAMMALLLYMAVPLRTYLTQRSRLADLERRTQLLERRNVQLQRQVTELSDPTYIERIARECLGMARPGEITFIVVPKTGTPDLPGC